MQSIPEISFAKLLDVARSVVEAEAAAVLALRERIDDRFVAALQAMLDCTARIVVTGIGKSGHIGHKIAATLASTGTPAFFVHPADAAHGDLGMITPADVVLALSNSGESNELTLILPIVKRHGAKLICITSRPRSTLARASDICLDLGVDREADPLGLAPTSSTTAALAFGDALAVALLSARGFSHEDFARSHPSGALGRRLLLRCKDVMRSGVATPRISPDATVADTLLETTRKGLGLCVIVDPATGRVLGVFTDGDLRRMLETRIDVHATRIAEIMTRSPHTIGAESLATEALRQFEQHSINSLPVVDENGVLVGALNMHDLLRAGVA
jgi:arabinose-5-phosphate isomerase